MTGPPGPKPEELAEGVTQPLLVIWGENDTLASINVCLLKLAQVTLALCCAPLQ